MQKKTRVRKGVPINLRISPHLKALLELAAQKRGISLSDLCRSILVKGVLE